MVDEITRILAFGLLIGLTTYFVIECVRAAALPHTNERRDIFGAVALAVIAALMIAVAIILLDPTTQVISGFVY